MQDFWMVIPDLQPAELAGIKDITNNMTDQQKQQFIMLYNGKRKRPSEILLLTCLGFVVVAGIQRFVLGQVGMGVLYLLTGGLCLIGTIIDAVNYKEMTTDYNLTQIYETGKMIKLMA